MEEKTNDEKNVEYKSNLKFLYLIRLSPSNKAFKVLSLKKASILLTFLCCLISFFQIIFDYKYTKYSCIVCPFFNLCLCGSLNIVSFIYFLKSYNKNNCQNAYKGNLAITWSFIIHSILLIINILFGLSFSPIDLFFIFDNNKKLRFLSFIFPNIFFLTYELYVTWICYSYTKHILEGHDALINGENYLYYNNKENDNSNIQLSDKINISM